MKDQPASQKRWSLLCRTTMEGSGALIRASGLGDDLLKLVF